MLLSPPERSPVLVLLPPRCSRLAASFRADRGPAPRRHPLAVPGGDAGGHGFVVVGGGPFEGAPVSFGDPSGVAVRNLREPPVNARQGGIPAGTGGSLSRR